MVRGDLFLAAGRSEPIGLQPLLKILSDQAVVNLLDEPLCLCNVQRGVGSEAHYGISPALGVEGGFISQEAVKLFLHLHLPLQRRRYTGDPRAIREERLLRAFDFPKVRAVRFESIEVGRSPELVEVLLVNIRSI